ncbi:hypothetical protein P43SY_007164 [Pythium insidiosum]|uniref:Transmembrane protein n=1 Tax=Pythium insidiosum TaxID=114742 RepID=A0AAD5LEC5_PYTIN|nr:hypothetical protein P43SY_007164 [Pythium insidiosum]
MAQVLPNAAVAVVSAWLLTWVVAQGNVLSGHAPQSQSPASFSAAATFWLVFVHAVGTVVVQAAPLQRRRSESRVASSLASCVARLLRRLWLPLVLTLLGTVAIAAVVVSTAPPTVQRARLHVQALRTHLRGSLLLGFVLVPLAVVHASSQLSLSSSLAVWVFSVASVVLKLLVGETILRLLRLRREGRRRKTTTPAAAAAAAAAAAQRPVAMHVLVAVPIVLIETQIRFYLVRLTSQRPTLHGARDNETSRSTSQLVTLLLAAVELAMRLGKLWYMTRKISRRLARVQRHSDGGTFEAFEQWKASVLSFHAASMQADMYAEYIAIGCSFAIYVFLDSHPQYVVDTRPPPSGLSLSRESAELVGLQLAVEVVVDVLCVCMALACGVPCRASPQAKRFFLVLFTSCALGNVTISAAMYIEPRGSAAARPSTQY